MRKKILFVEQSSTSWMGGIYYIKNQIEQLLHYKPAREQFIVYLYITNKHKREYVSLLNYKNVKMIFKETILNKFFVQITNLINENLNGDIAYLVYKYNISYIFPYFPIEKINKILFLKKSISWIPDFQHIHLPNLFSKNELDGRNKYFREIAVKHNKLVLSSQNAYTDYIRQYPKYKKRVYVIPFCSVLDKKIVENDEIDKIKLKYKIEGNYFIICNQFWMHKNYIFAFKAFKEALIKDKDMILVCTGNIKDYRNKKYIGEIKRYIIDNKLQNNIFLLGLIDRKEQIQLLKGAIALIQPSLFEGWGTSVEDAKTLNKKILLSDIDVHHEQMDENCQLFNPFNPEELTQMLLELWNQEKYKLQTGTYSLRNASRYGKLFYEMLRNS